MRLRGRSVSSRALVLVGFVVVAGTLRARPPQTPPLHLQQASSLLSEIRGQQSLGVFYDANNNPLNSYGGSWNSLVDPSYIRFADPTTGTLAANRTTCSPLVSRILQSTYQWNWKAYSFVDPISNLTVSTSSPYSYQYIALMKQGKGFASTSTNLGTILPGDILSGWKIGSTDNDHTMMVASIDFSAGQKYPSGRAASDSRLVGTVLYPVTIIDSTTYTHTDDTRLVNVNGTIQQISGIGRGVIGALADPQGNIVGCVWSLPKSNVATNPDGWLNSVNTNLKWAGAATPWEILSGRLATP